MYKHVLCAAIACSTFAVGAGAQTKPTSQTRPTTQTRPAASPATTARATATPDEINDVLMRLQNTPTHDRALADAKTYPETALLPFWDFIADGTKPVQPRKDLVQALLPIYERARAARSAEDASKLAAWKAAAMDVYSKHYADPKWDAAVAKAFGDATGENESAYAALKSAIDAGCIDPRVRLNYVIRSLDGHRMDVETGVKQLRVVAAEYELSPYSTGQKFLAFCALAHWLSQPEAPLDVTESERDNASRRANALFAGVIKENPGGATTSALLKQLREALVEVSGAELSYGPRPYLEALDTLNKNAPGSAWEAVMDAESQDALAKVLGNGGEVRDKRMALFTKMRDAASKGWRADPMDPSCAVLMIRCLMRMDGPPNDMEMWFQRAVLADPHSCEAYKAKADFLVPQWDGNPANSIRYGNEAVAFAKTCVKVGDADDRVPTLALRIYERLAYGYGNSDDFFTGVWPDAKAACEKLLQDKTRLQTHRTSYLKDRAEYLRLASDFHRWADVAALIRDYGTEFDLEAFGGQALFDYCKKRVLGDAPGTPATPAGTRASAPAATTRTTTPATRGTPPATTRGTTTRGATTR